MKLAHGPFRGYPAFSQFIQERFKHVPLLKDFKTVEQCSLEYNPDVGASIDPHIDDCWIWGERIVTVNCESDCILTLVKYVLNYFFQLQHILIYGISMFTGIREIPNVTIYL